MSRRRLSLPTSRAARLAIAVGIVLGGYAWQQLALIDVASAPDPARIARAFAERRSGFMVELEGTMVRELADDSDGSRHQRFVLELADGHTVLVAHNLDLAPRVPVKPGAPVQLSGQYEWSEREGVLHWTHHDPDRRREGGWIRFGGRLYE